MRIVAYYSKVNKMGTLNVRFLDGNYENIPQSGGIAHLSVTPWWKSDIKGALPARHSNVTASDGPILPVGLDFDIFILLITLVFQFSL